jgi:hypothetical protein
MPEATPFPDPRNAPGVRLPVLPLALVAPALLLAVLAPAAAATPSLDVSLDAPLRPLGQGEAMEFTVTYTLRCGDPPPPEFDVVIEMPEGNYFNATLDRASWSFTAQECVAAGGTLTRTVHGTFSFNPAYHHLMTPFSRKEFPVSVYVEQDGQVYASDLAMLAAVPDAFLRMGATRPEPSRAERADDGYRVWAQWTVRNHGRGEFVADLEVAAKPDWLGLEMPATVTSPADEGTGPSVTFDVVATMPDPCPQQAAVVNLRVAARSPVPGSSAAETAIVQGYFACPPPGVPEKASPAPSAVLALLLVAGAAAGARKGKR